MIPPDHQYDLDHRRVGGLRFHAQPSPNPGTESAPQDTGRDIIALVRFLRMKPGHGEVLIAEGDVELAEDEQRLVEEFRRQLDDGLWAAVPMLDAAGRRQAHMVKTFKDVPRDADRVIFFPRAAGGR